MISSGAIVDILDGFQGEVKKWIAEGRDATDTERGDKWRVLSGTIVNNIKSEFRREFAKVNYAKWMAVKYFEFMHEYNLEYMAELHPDVPLEDEVEGTRQWPGSDRTVFEIAPHFTADNWLHFADQPLLEGRYMSSAWYQLQMVLHSGEYDQLQKGGPMDWSYHFGHIYHMTDAGAPREGFRFISSYIKLWQTRSNNRPLDDFEKGWRMRYVHPWRIYSHENGNQSSMEELNVNDPGLRVKIYNAVIAEWVKEVRRHNLATWPREYNDWTRLDPETHIPSAENVDFGSNRLWKSSKQYHADFFYILIPRLIDLGVDREILDGLIDWCKEAWPLGDWEKWKEHFVVIQGVDIEDPGVRVYPNPANDRIQIMGIEQGSQMSLISHEGRVLWRGISEKRECSIDVHRYTPGIYIMQISGDQKNEVIRIAIQH